MGIIISGSVRHVFFVVLSFLLAGAADVAFSVDEDSVKKIYPSEGKVGQEFRDAAAELRCPTCTGLSVLESDAKFSVQIKDIVLEKVNEGKSKDEILQYFTERYGPWILRAPPKSGVNLVAWAVPLALLTIGPLLVWLLVWRRKKVVVDFKVRATDDIIGEMNQRIEALRSAVGGKS